MEIETLKKANEIWDKISCFEDAIERFETYKSLGDFKIFLPHEYFPIFEKYFEEFRKKCLDVFEREKENLKMQLETI